MYIMFKSLFLLFLSCLLFIFGLIRLIIGILIFGYCLIRGLAQCYNLYAVPIISAINQIFFSFTGFMYYRNKAITKEVVTALCMSIILNFTTAVLLYEIQTVEFQNAVVYTYIGQSDFYPRLTLTNPLVDDVHRYLSCCGTWNTSFPGGHKLPLSCCETSDLQTRVSHGEFMKLCIAGHHHKTPCITSLKSFICDYAWLCITLSIPVLEVMVSFTMMAIQRSQQIL